HNRRVSFPKVAVPAIAHASPIFTILTLRISFPMVTRWAQHFFIALALFSGALDTPLRAVPAIIDVRKCRIVEGLMGANPTNAGGAEVVSLIIHNWMIIQLLLPISGCRSFSG